MRKLNFKVTAVAIMIAIGAMSIGFTSCQKEATIIDQTSPNPTSGVNGNSTTRSVDEEFSFNGSTFRISNGMLDFTSFGHYEAIFNWSQENI